VNDNSVSKLLLILEVKDKFKLNCELKRHLSPTLVGKISRSLPLIGNSHIIKKSAIYFETSVDAGIQRAKREFKEGDIAFLSAGHAICFFHTDYTTHKDMSIIGKIVDDVKLLEKVESGDEIKLYCDDG
tara:strand:+ start:1265 stop:1651 length:387 start_codon:yes stop_codon:yes gene_type:complete